MRKLVIIEFLTVDGVMQGLGSPDEDRDGGFEHGGWGAPFGESVGRSVGAGGFGGTGAYLFGRRTYEKMADFWPHQGDDNPIAVSMNSTPKYVVTQTLRHVDWAGTTIISGDVAPSVTELKASGDGDIVVLGSGVLVQALLDNDLVDEMRLFVHPLLLGTGKRLFRSFPSPRRLSLDSVSSTDMGSLVLSYSFAQS